MKQILPYLLCLLIAFSCKKDDEAINTITNTAQPTQAVTDLEFQETNFGEAKLANFIGVIKNINGTLLKDVQILIENQSTYTNHQGVFILNDVSVFEKFAFVKAIKEGYITGSRTITPNTNGGNTIEITLLKDDTLQTVNSGEISNVTLTNGAEVEFSGHFIDSNNNPYNGQVNVALNYLEPNQDDTFNQMPGMLFGKRIDGSASAMETYGMINVTLSATNGEALNIAPESPATLTFPISTTTPNAPETIPLWSFNEALGYWIEEGTAIKSGNEYIATVSHFTWWNVDFPLNSITGCLNINYNNTNLTDFIIKITRDQTNQIIYTGSSNNLGNLCGLFPKNETLTIKVYANNDCFSDLVQEEQVGPFTADTNLNITINNLSTNLRNTLITGILTNCNNETLTNAYAFLYNSNYSDTKIVEITNGELNYNFLHCANNDYFIRISDNDTNQVSNSISLNLQNNTLDLITLNTCNTSGDTFTGDVALENQEEVNAFGLFNYTSIDGNLTIGDTGLNNISSLLPLQTITNITRDIEIKGTQLTSLQGLNNLTTANRNFEILNNSQLISLEGLNNLTNVTNEFTITLNRLTNLEGLDNFTTAGSLTIRSNSSLTSIEGLRNLTTINNNLTISYIPRLTSLVGLDNLTTINNNLTIYTNIELTSLESLNNVATTVHNLIVSRNHKLTSLEGLNNLTTINNNITIGENNELTSLEGLNNLATINNNFTIEQNNELTSLEGLNNLTTINGSLNIFDQRYLTSLNGLNSITTIEENLFIKRNRLLSNLCSLQSIFTSNNTEPQNTQIHTNLYNPTIQDFINGDCSQ